MVQCSDYDWISVCNIRGLSQKNWTGKNTKYFSFCESELVMISSFSITSKAGLKLNILCV